LDHAIGQVVQALEETGQRENTIIFFSSDNGPQVNWPGNAYPDDLNLTDFNQPDTLRGYKGDTYEGGILVPGLINWPSQIVPGVVDEPVHIVDWMPTLAAMVGYTPAEDPKWDGTDISPLIHQADSLGSRTLYWLWKNALPTTNCRWALRHGDWKIVRYGNEPAHANDWALYNLATDPQETTDVASSNSAKVAELHALFLIERAGDIPNRMISPRLVVPDTASGPFGVTLNFSESVTGLDLGDLVVSNGTASGLSGSGTFYSFTVTPTLSSNGVVSVYLPAGGATASSGLVNVPSQVAVVKFDSSMPGAFGPLGRGIGGIETATGDGFIMYSEESIHTRFSASPPNSYQADHFVAVRSNGGTWEYDNNSSYVAFTPVASDLLVAAVDFSADTVTMLSGTSNVVNGIAYGYQSGDLIVIPGMWNGGPNPGEFGLDGSYIVLHGGAVIGEMPSGLSVSLFAPWATSASSFTVGAEFSEDVTGLTLGDFSVSNSSLAVLSGTNRSYELEITPASCGVVSIDLHTNAVNEGTVPVVGTITHWNDYYVWANALQADPSNPSIRDPNGDWDMDGQNNIREYFYGGDPTAADATLAATLIVQNPVGPEVDVAFPVRDSVASRVGLQYSDDLVRWFAPGEDLSGVSNPPPSMVSAAKGTLNIVTDAVWGDVSMYSYTVAPSAGEISAPSLFFRVGGTL
jgi:hypothetical protein